MSNTSKRKARSGRSASKAPNESQQKGKALERIVTLLEAVLSDRDIEIKVRHSLIDRSTGELREVDIHIEEKLRGQIRASVIECRCHNKKVDLTYIEQIVTKRADIGNPHTYVVSKSGFTKGAMQKASHHNIGLSTLAETNDPLWPEWLVNKAAYELRLHAERRSFNPIWVSDREQAVTLTDELKQSNDDTLVFLDKDGIPRGSIISAIREGIGRLSAEDMRLIRQAVQEKGNFNIQMNLLFAEPRFVKFAEGLVQIAGFQIDLDVTLRNFPLVVSLNVYRDITTALTRGESISCTLADETLVAVVRDPASNQMFVTASPPEGRKDLNLQIVVVGEDQHGNEIIGTGFLVSAAPTIPPKLIIPRATNQ